MAMARARRIASVCGGAGLSVGPEPLFVHRQDPDHFAVVARVACEILAQETVDEFGTYEPAGAERAQGVERHVPQAAVLCEPYAERKSKAVLAFSDDRGRK